jgi:pimeloyl-ACP methyl ester carboxylesterase
MAVAPANGITLEYETSGEPDRPPLLLIMGLGGQLVAWDEEFVKSLVERGFYVIRFDNRDVGKSTWLDDLGVPDLAAALTGGPFEAPYLLDDMAHDTAGLLDALGIESAHVLGVSMGGMIAQSFTIGYPERVRTLTSIMSTTGAPGVGQPHDEAAGALLMPVPPGRDAALDAAVAVWKVIGSPGFPFHEDRIRDHAGAAYDRGVHPAGFLRQMAAIIASPDRTAGLEGIHAPTLVIHGEGDVLVDPSGGRATAAAVPGAELWMVPGMGHELPVEMFTEFADRIAGHTTRG